MPGESEMAPVKVGGVIYFSVERCESFFFLMEENKISERMDVFKGIELKSVF